MNPLVKEFGKEKRWVNYKILEMKGKKTKIPFFTKTSKASSTDSKTWKTYEDASDDANNGSNGFDGVGFVFKEDEMVLGIDIDHCLERVGKSDYKIVHPEAKAIRTLMLAADTYAEVSPSKTGIHLYFKLSEAWKPLANKKAPFELYSHGRYFTVTEDVFGKSKPVRTVSPDEIEKILKEAIGYPWEKAPELAKPFQNENLNHLVRDDEVVLKKMFGSKNGKDIEALYKGDLSNHKNDASSADMALCAHLAFWTGRNAFQIERLWLASPLGSRKKTVERKDYRDRTIAAAIKNCKEIYETTSDRITKENPELDLLFTLSREKEKIFTQNTENICRVLKRHKVFADTLRYDIFKNTFEREVISPSNVRVWRGLEDNDAVDIQTQIQVLFPCFGRVGKDMVYDAIIKVSKENAIDSASDFIRSLKWDGEKRLDDWLSETYGVPKDKYHRAVGSNWLKGLVKRIVQPGCKFDYVLVLEGEQGTKKSTSLAVLGGGWHVETTMSTDSKDFFMQFCGKAIVEFSEGETLSRTEVKRMKAIITMQTDKYRPPYERTSQEFPRRCVFAMTTNQTEYLKDETGNRRWLPVAVTLPESNVEWLAENRDQLFAEAYHRIHELKETIYEFPKEETRKAQDDRRINDPNSDTIVSWYMNELTPKAREEGITVPQVYRYALHGGFVSKPLDKYNEMIIADTLRRILNLERKRLMLNGLQSWRWVAKGGLFAQAKDEMVEDALSKLDRTS